MRRERKIAVKFLIVRLLLTFALFSHVIYRLRRIDKPVKTGWIIIPNRYHAINDVAQESIWKTKMSTEPS